MVAFKYISSKLTSEEVWFLAQRSKLGNFEEEDPEDDDDQEEEEGKKKKDKEKVKNKYISFQPFLRALRRSIPEANEMFALRSQYLQEFEGQNVFNDLESDCSDYEPSLNQSEIDRQ